MFSIHDYLLRRRARKAMKAMRATFRLYEDTLPNDTRLALVERFDDLRDAIKDQSVNDLDDVVKPLQEELNAVLPKPRWPLASEWFDVIVSALAVAFCFRAYYYEPFRIPTGSMQPTLYGIHFEPADGPSTWDKGLLSHLKWCVTGKTYEEVRVRTSGIVTQYIPNANPGYVTLVVNGRDRYELPEDVARTLASTAPNQGGLPPGTRIHAGQVLWRGYVKSGDFLFVNRWIWNFRHPRLGETIVFSTRGIGGELPDNQHYIKRLCGRPGDTVELKPESTHLYVNGAPATNPNRLEEIARHAKPWDGAPPYPGYKPKPNTVAGPNGERIDLPGNAQTFTLGPGEYLALGDNSDNSLDSRYWGKVPAKNLLGPATFVHWPFTSPRWGFIR